MTKQIHRGASVLLNVNKATYTLLYIISYFRDRKDAGVQFAGDRSGSGFVPVRETPNYPTTPSGFHTTPPAIEFVKSSKKKQVKKCVCCLKH